MFHGRDHSRPMTEAEREKLASEGETFQGIVLQNDPLPEDRQMSALRVSVRYKDGQEFQFHEVVASLYQPAPGSPEAKRLAEIRAAQQVHHPDRIPKIQLFISLGERVPVRYDAADRSRIVLDIPAMRQYALREYIKSVQKPKPQPQKPVSAGPPWVVPTQCPNCGAPVDQALASRDADPKCTFCDQPLPVTPLR